MSLSRPGPAALLAAGSLLTATPAIASCGAAYCSVNTSWENQSALTRPGLHLDLRWEYIDLDNLRSGSAAVAPAGLPGSHDELRTLNRSLLAGVDYNFNRNWGASLQIPLVARDHQHLHNNPLPELESWQFTALGDVRALGRYRFDGADGAAPSFGLQAGLKLPTGRQDETNDAGEVAERSLQPGTGTTDTLLGAFYSHPIEGDGAGWFAQLLWQRPLAAHEGYQPGQQLSLDLGAHYAIDLRWNALVQLNTHWKDRDAGAVSEPDDSGGLYVHVSPGLSYTPTGHFRLYAFVQWPLYQYVNGTQLTADWSAAAGVSYRL